MQSLNDKLADFFKRNPERWIDGKELAEIAGGYGWRSRCSDLRKFYGMTIENRQRTVTSQPWHQSKLSWRVSEYRYVPQAGQQSLSL